MVVYILIKSSHGHLASLLNSIFGLITILSGNYPIYFYVSNM